jgi:hypothetical protein
MSSTTAKLITECDANAYIKWLSSETNPGKESLME